MCLQPNKVYRCLARAINQAGLISDPQYSDGFTIDPTPPEGGWVLDGDTEGHDQLLTASSTTLAAIWGGFSDIDYGIAHYEVGIGECGAPVHEVPTFNVSHASQHNFVLAKEDGECTYMPTSHTCRFAHGVSYCVTVRAVNVHGGVTDVKSNGVRACLEPPQAGSVSDGYDPNEPDEEMVSALRYPERSPPLPA